MKAKIVAVSEESRRKAMGTSHHNAEEAMRPWAGCPSLRQPGLNRNSSDKCTDLKNFEMVVTNIFLRHYGSNYS